MFRSDEVDLKYYGLVIGRWKRLILTVAGVCVGLAFVLNLVMQPIYRAVTRLPGIQHLSPSGLADLRSL